MNDLIEALTIFAKYTDAHNPTDCTHDTLHVNVNPTDVSKKDIKRLSELSFSISDVDTFYSYRFGSC